MSELPAPEWKMHYFFYPVFCHRTVRLGDDHHGRFFCHCFCRRGRFFYHYFYRRGPVFDRYFYHQTVRLDDDRHGHFLCQSAPVFCRRFCRRGPVSLNVYRSSDAPAVLFLLPSPLVSPPVFLPVSPLVSLPAFLLVSLLVFLPVSLLVSPVQAVLSRLPVSELHDPSQDDRYSPALVFPVKLPVFLPDVFLICYHSLYSEDGTPAQYFFSSVPLPLFLLSSLIYQRSFLRSRHLPPPVNSYDFLLLYSSRQEIQLLLYLTHLILLLIHIL